MACVDLHLRLQIHNKLKEDFAIFSALPTSTKINIGIEASYITKFEKEYLGDKVPADVIGLYKTNNVPKMASFLMVNKGIKDDLKKIIGNQIIGVLNSAVPDVITPVLTAIDNHIAAIAKKTDLTTFR